MVHLLQKRRVVVTGGFGSLGRSVASTLQAHGAIVALLDCVAPPSEGPSAAVELGGVDLSDAISTRSAFATVAEKLGGIDALVNVAGGFAWERVGPGSIDTWDRLYAMNVRTAVLACQHATPYLIREKGGRIVNVGALAAQKAGLGMGAYAASKAGVARLTEALAEELKEHEITVNAVLPSIIDTPANRADMPDADFSRWVAANQLAEVIAFLLSDSAAAVTGALIPVAGRM